MAKYVVGVLWFALWSSATSAATLPKIYVDPAKGGHFVDDLGRVRMFRGVNSVQKVCFCCGCEALIFVMRDIILRISSTRAFRGTTNKCWRTR